MNPQALIAAAKKDKRAALDEIAGKQLLASFGVSVPKSVIAKNAADVAKAIAGMQPPFALKVMSPEILHKSDAGGVKIGLKSAEEVAQAITSMAAAPQIRQARVDGWLVEEMAPAGQEVVVGAVRDPNFGPLVMVGLGGIFVEILADVQATLDYFGEIRIVRGDSLAILGHCMGGRMAFLGGAANPSFRASVIYYCGNMFKPWGEGVPAPFDRLSGLKGSVIGFFGNDDKNPSPDDVTKIDQALTKVGIRHEFHRYDGAGHAFQNFVRPDAHRPAQADDAWAKTLAFLRRELGNQ